jgi:hypothetical protein
MFPFVARPVPAKYFGMAAAGLVLTLLSAWLAGLLGRDYPPGRESAAWAGFVAMGLITLLLLLRAFDREDILRIGPSGLWYRLWSDDIIPWREIRDVSVWTVRGQKAILLHLVDPVRFPPSTLQGKAGSKDKFITGGDIAIALTGTDRSFDQAMAAIEEYRQ